MSVYQLIKNDEKIAKRNIFDFAEFSFRHYLAKGWYSFTTGTFKPYVAVGVGLARVEEPDINAGNDTIYGAKRYGLGANPELGFSIGGFNLSYSFNVGGKTPKEPVFNDKVKDLVVRYHRFAIGYIYNF